MILGFVICLGFFMHHSWPIHCFKDHSKTIQRFKNRSNTHPAIVIYLIYHFQVCYIQLFIGTPIHPSMLYIFYKMSNSYALFNQSASATISYILYLLYILLGVYKYMCYIYYLFYIRHSYIYYIRHLPQICYSKYKSYY